MRLSRLFRQSHRRRNSFGPIAIGARPTGASSPTNMRTPPGPFWRINGSAVSTSFRYTRGACDVGFRKLRWLGSFQMEK